MGFLYKICHMTVPELAWCRIVVLCLCLYSGHNKLSTVFTCSHSARCLGAYLLDRGTSDLVLQNQEKWQIADPICTLTFAVIVFCTTIRMVRDIADIVMERVPRGYSIAKTAHDLAMVCTPLTELKRRLLLLFHV